MVESPGKRVFNIVLVGDSAVGKSCITKRFVYDEYSNLLGATIGVDICSKTVNIDEQLVKLQIWDTAGHERFRTLMANYFREKQGIVFVYDCTHEETFEQLTHWFQEVDRYASKDVVKVVVGNKSDANKMVNYSTGKECADSLGIPFFEISAKTGDNVESMFIHLAALIKSQMATSSPRIRSNIELKSPAKKPKSKCC